tara:strand:+ start:230 stop:493 length:264 start_codon:yes stop_codon:yes gene_type:complete
MANTNPCGKTRKLEDPYEVWECRMDMGFGDIINIEYRVLKKYKNPKNESQDPLARWFTAAKSEATFGSWEYGDTYVRDIITTGRRVK